MLDLLRRKAQSPIIQFTVVIIAVVFVFWGVGSSQKNSGDDIAKVNDESISNNEYRKSFDRITTAYRDQLGESLPQELIESLGVKEQALEQLIQRALLRQGAREMGLAISALEVRQAVESSEAFRKNGVFDMTLYKAILGGSRMTPSSYEASLRADMIAGKLLESMARLAKVTPTEVEERALYENQQINLEYVSFSASDLTDKTELSEEELTAYYDEHSSEYMTNPQLSVRYLAFPLDGFLAQVEPSDKDYSDFYSLNFDRFTIPEMRSARHILLKVDSLATDEVVEKRRQEADDILSKALDGADFAELAKQYSEGPSAAQGGNLGFFGKNQMVPEFENEVFSLQESEVSQVIRTSFGLHIIKLDAINPSRIIPLEEAKKEIAAEVKRTQARSLARAASNTAYEDIILAGSLIKYGESAGVDVKTTGFFEKSAPPADSIVQEPAFLEAAFALNKGDMSSLVKLNKGFAILYAEDLKAPEAKPLDTVRDQLTTSATEERAEAMAKEAAENLLAAAKESGDWVGEIQKVAATLDETGFFSRQDPVAIATKMLPPAFLEGGFSRTEAAPLAETILQRSKTYYVYRLKEQKAPEEEMTPELLATLQDRILEEKKTNLLNSWLNGLKEQATIEIKSEYL